MVEGDNGDIMSDPIQLPAVEEVETKEVTPKEEPHSEEPVIKPPSDVGSNESFRSFSVGGSVMLASIAK